MCRQLQYIILFDMYTQWEGGVQWKKNTEPSQQQCFQLGWLLEEPCTTYIKLTIQLTLDDMYIESRKEESAPESERERKDGESKIIYN